ncbi:outer membrane protein [Sulfitobacter sp. S190]|uniref:outer membrane protein n=1 Tax=Sulfitobacter sp. S190 TaxID=2867022 RepID=UPI0021A7DDE0|nr:porin [Sulfitobacter sp. S190]UWR23782.1 outer membrane beta-barrel protein [Sulfitobacter sp. S190]
MKNLSMMVAAAGISAAALSTTAFAGTLQDPVIEEPIAPAPQIVSTGGDWTGFYGGLNLGYGDVDTNADVDGDGGTYGVHLGYDYDFGRYVLGGELEYDKFDVTLGDGDGSVEVDDVARLKIRGGYDLGRTLIYATGGLARVSTEIGDENGEFLGLGVAYQVNDRFTVGGEVLEHRFDDIDGSGVDADATTFNLRGSIRF